MSLPLVDLPRGGPALPALLLAVDAVGLGGALLDHPLHEQASAFARLVRRALPVGAPLRRVPSSVTPDRLYGGVDLAATLSTGRLVAERGVLAAADGGLIVVPMAERLSVAARTAICEVLDHAAVQVARDGVAERHAARLCAVLMDESTDDERVHDALRDRLAFVVRVEGAAALSLVDDDDDERDTSWAEQVADARARLAAVVLEEQWVKAMCETADAFGVDSVRATLMALRCARAHAALHGRVEVTEADAEAAAALVLAPRATRIPPPPEEAPPEDAASPPPPPPEAPPEPPQAETPPPEPEQPDDTEPPEPDKADDDREESLSSNTELLREAVQSALPPGMLSQLLERANSGAMQGRVGAEQQNMMRGRPRGARSGLPRGGARLHLLETLRAAAPWQRVRVRTEPEKEVVSPTARPRVRIRREDFRIRRFVEKTGTTVVFVVDASGSSALNRLAECKGAVELLLAESYARRDRVSLIAFRGQGTELLLPPTRALARAKKVLAALPGGGGTPLAHAIDAAMEQALSAKRAGSAPLVVMLTDGRANIARDGTPGRAGAERDALLAGARFTQHNIPALFVDTSNRGEAVARRIADAMRARYVLLPAANAKALGGLVRTALQMADGASHA